MPDFALVRQGAESDEQLVALWLHGRPPNTQRAYRRDAGLFRQCCPGDLRQITLANLQAFADSLTTSAASQRRTLNAVKSLIAFGHRIGYLPFDVGAVVQLRRPKNTLAARILDRESVLRMIDLEPGPRNQSLLRMLYDSGLRVSELTSVTWADVQPRNHGCCQITVMGKGSRTRVVLIGPGAFAALPTRGAPEEPVFPSKSGRPLDQSRVWRIVREAARRAGIEANVSAHWLRHACASHALDGGAPVHLVQQQLGHASLETTTQYSHARPDDGLFRYLG